MMVFLYPMMVFLYLYDGLPLSIIMMVFLYPMDPMMVFLHPIDPMMVFPYPMDPIMVFPYPMDPMMAFPYPMDPMMVFPYPMDPMMAFPYPMDPSLAGQTLFFSFLFIGGVVGRKIIVWSNLHAKFVLHCLRISWTGNEKGGWAKQPQALNICDLL